MISFFLAKLDFSGASLNLSRILAPFIPTLYVDVVYGRSSMALGTYDTTFEDLAKIIFLRI
jgi:hypothetical protein